MLISISQLKVFLILTITKFAKKILTAFRPIFCRRKFVEKIVENNQFFHKIKKNRKKFSTKI